MAESVSSKPSSQTSASSTAAATATIDSTSTPTLANGTAINSASTSNPTSATESKFRLDVPIICPGHSRPVPDIAFTDQTADGYFLVSACLDNKAMIRDGSSGDWIGTFMGHKGAVWQARLNRDASRAVTAAADFSAKLWNALTGVEIHTWNHKHIVKTAVFSSDQRNVYTGGQEKLLRIFDLENVDSEPQILTGHSASIISAVSLADPNLILTAAAEKDLRVWDKRMLKCVKTLPTSADVTSMQSTINGQVISISAGKTVEFYNSSTFELIKQYTLDREINSVSYDGHSNVKKFVTGSELELWVRGYDFDSGEEVFCMKGHHGPVRSLAFAPSGEAFASGSVDGTIRIWNWNSCQHTNATTNSALNASQTSESK